MVNVTIDGIVLLRCTWRVMWNYMCDAEYELVNTNLGDSKANRPSEYPCILNMFWNKMKEKKMTSQRSNIL